MRAAYPYIDDFLPAGTVASLERLGEILAGVRAGDTRRGGEAAATVTSTGPSHPIRVPVALETVAADPSVARPLTR
jgi:hypothetical protein